LQLSGLLACGGKAHRLTPWNLIQGALLQSDIAGYALSEILAKENKPFSDRETVEECTCLRTVADTLFLRERQSFFFLFKADH
jgi:hypothetical protein